VFAFEFSEIFNLINIFLGFLLSLLAVSYMKFYSRLNEWWRRLLFLAYIFILQEVVVFMGFRFFGIVMKTILLGYFLYFLSFITNVIKDLDDTKAEMAHLQERLKKMNIEE
jgi:hypothetical protein